MRLLEFLNLLARRISSRLFGSDSTEERNIRYLTLDTAWAGIASAAIGTFVPIFLVRLGADSYTISALTALPALVTIVVSLPASAYVEQQHNHARTTAVFRALASSTYWLLALLPFAAVAGLPQFIVVLWVLQAIPQAVTTSSFTSTVGDIVPPRRRPVVNGTRWALVSIVQAVAVVAFGKFLDAGWLPFPLNYQLVFLVAAATSVLNVVLFARIRMSRDYVAAVVRVGLRERLTALVGPMLRAPAFMRFLLVAFVVQLGVQMPVALFGIFWVRNLGASDTVIGLRTTVGQAAVVAGSYLFGRYASRRGHRGVLIVSAIGSGLYPLVTALSPNVWWMLPAAALWGFFAGGINVAFFEGILDTTPPEKRPSFTALYSVFVGVANFAGPLAGSLLANVLSIYAAFVISAGVLFAGALLSWWVGVGRHAQVGPAPEPHAS